MVSNCANPTCCTPLRYLRDGRLYQFEVKTYSGSGADDQTSASLRKMKPARKVWHYWLCGRCSSILTLKFDQVEGLKVMPLPRPVPEVAVEQWRMPA
jgi:hypothetical protein